MWEPINQNLICDVMKYLILISLLFVVFGCKTEPKERPIDRIVIVEQKIQNSERFTIIRVDGVEYIAYGNSLVRIKE